MERKHGRQKMYVFVKHPFVDIQQQILLTWPQGTDYNNQSEKCFANVKSYLLSISPGGICPE